jgi:hypothetical protein
MGMGDDVAEFMDNYDISTTLRAWRDEPQTQLHKIYKSAPRADDEAYGKAQTALKESEELTFLDAEIEVFLPAPLRRTSQVVG